MDIKCDIRKFSGTLLTFYNLLNRLYSCSHFQGRCSFKLKSLISNKSWMMISEVRGLISHHWIPAKNHELNFGLLFSAVFPSFPERSSMAVGWMRCPLFLFSVSSWGVIWNSNHRFSHTKILFLGLEPNHPCAAGFSLPLRKQHWTNSGLFQPLGHVWFRWANEHQTGDWNLETPSLGMFRVFEKLEITQNFVIFWQPDLASVCTDEVMTTCRS